ncbi:MAG: hypothetical protein Kow0056_07070 [Coriobacteriia bacterium]
MPLIADIFGLTAYQAFVAFACIFLGLAALSTVLGTFRFSHATSTRVLGVLTALGLTFVALKIGDTYLAMAALPMYVVVWMLPLPRKGLGPHALWWALAAGLVAGVCSAIRSQAALPLLGFTVVLLLATRDTSARRRWSFLAALIAGMLIVQVLVSWQVAQRDDYLAETYPEYAAAPARHVLWHSLYVGLGYVSNPWVPEVTDDVARSKAAQIDPEAAYPSARYEEVIRQATLQFVREHPRWFLEGLAAKTGVTFMYIFFFGIAGLVALLMRPTPLTGTDTAFGIAVFLGALPGILVYPEPAFILGALTFSGLWGLYRWDVAREGQHEGRLAATDDREARHALERAFHDESVTDIELDEIPVLQTFEGPTSPEPAYVLRQFGDISGTRILDLGCGAGEASVYFALQGAEVTALDISPQQCSLTKRLAVHWGVADKVKTVCTPIEAVDLEEQFDFIYGYGVLHHVDIAQTAAVIRRLLKPGGTAGFIEPLAYNPVINVYRKMAHAVRTPTERPIRHADLRVLKAYFPEMVHRESQLFTLLIYVWMFAGERLHPPKTKYWKRILTHAERYGPAFRVLETIDKVVLNFPALRWLCYTTTIILPKPETRSVSGAVGKPAENGGPVWSSPFL